MNNLNNSSSDQTMKCYNCNLKIYLFSLENLKNVVTLEKTKTESMQIMDIIDITETRCCFLFKLCH